ncbi:MAG: hypothetical protein HDS35_10900 [Bacteroides sp.]|nr:hypothetical protein [Bacteroides sp.]
MITTITTYGFTTVEDAIASGTALCKTANDAGIFLREDDPARDRLTLKRVRRESKDWLKAVRKQIDTMSVGDALKLLDTYDSVHRVAYGTPADPTFLNRYTMAAFESRIRGNKEVDPYILYRQINAGIARRDPLYLGRPLQWSTTVLDRWYKELSGGYSTFSGGHNRRGKGGDKSADSLYDRLQKASILMETDLWAYEGANQKAFKQQLYDKYRTLSYSLY